VLAVPPSVQEMEMIDYKRIKDELIAFEMQAFAELFHFWAADKKPRRKLSKNRERLEDFRKALLGDEYSIHREDVPHELVYDEYQLARHAVPWRQNPDPFFRSKSQFRSLS